MSDREQARILIVDVEGSAREELVRSVAALGYAPELARDGYDGLSRVHQEIDLVLLEISLPGMDGFELLQAIRQDDELKSLPVILLSANDNREDRLRGVRARASDFLARPVDPVELETRLACGLARGREMLALRERLAAADRQVARKSSSLKRALDEAAEARRTTYKTELDTLHRLALAAELRDPEAPDHIFRVSRYCELLARASRLAPNRVELVRAASPLHDVGKIGIPDAILFKPGSLDDDEWETMKQHTILGARILEGSNSALIQAGERVALTHHERWDGTGYPYGLTGEDIPLEGRICALADAFDALTMDRPYRKALPVEEAFRLIEQGRGAQFDPTLVDLWLQNREPVLELRSQSSGQDLLQERR